MSKNAIADLRDGMSDTISRAWNVPAPRDMAPWSYGARRARGPPWLRVQECAGTTQRCEDTQDDDRHQVSRRPDRAVRSVHESMTLSIKTKAPWPSGDRDTSETISPSVPVCWRPRSLTSAGYPERDADETAAALNTARTVESAMDDAIVYVVDDDSSVCRAIARLIRAVGLAVQTFPSAKAFLEH